MKGTTESASVVAGLLSLTSFMTWEVGFGWENLFEKIKTSPRISNLEKDKKVEGKYGFRGSIDIFANLDGEPTVFELKSVSSVSSFEKVFINRNPPDSYISQCAAYMLATGAKQGFLVFGFFSYVGKEYMTAGTRAKLGEKLAPDITEFKITIENDDILIDGQFHCPVSAIERHQEVVTNSLKTGTPYPIRSQGGMCFFCPFKKVCDSLDRGEINGDFFKDVSIWGCDLIITNPPFSLCIEAVAKSLRLLNNSPNSRLLFLMPLDWNCSQGRAKAWEFLDAHIRHIYPIADRVDYLKEGIPMSKCQKIIQGVPQFKNRKPVMNSGRQCYDAVFDIRLGKQNSASTLIHKP